uniref:Uncharacterized protein n=1 Tax=Micrurus lemniscatus lemniscatus TaxID=129467 RepID=A0A2D4I442_MICLE
MCGHHFNFFKTLPPLHCSCLEISSVYIVAEMLTLHKCTHSVYPRVNKSVGQDVIMGKGSGLDLSDLCWVQVLAPFAILSSRERAWTFKFTYGSCRNVKY